MAVPESFLTARQLPSQRRIINDFQAGFTQHCALQMVSYFTMSTLAGLAARIHRELEGVERYVIYELELTRMWPLNEKDRETKIAAFAMEHGFRLRFYRMGWCAVFDRPR